MINLKTWHMDSGEYNGKIYTAAYGYVCGHEIQRDGKYIHTSVIESLEVREEDGKLCFLTHSGNSYEVCFRDIEEECMELTKSALKVLEVDESFLGRFSEVCRREKAQYTEKIRKLLDDKELFLEMQGRKLVRALWKNGKTIRQIRIWPSISIVAIAADVLEEIVDFRFQSFDGYMEPSHWSESVKAVRIFNGGTRNIMFAGNEGEVLCEVGKITKVSRNSYKERKIYEI